MVIRRLATFQDRGEQGEKLADCPDLLYNRKPEDLAGVAEWVEHWT